MEGGRGIMPNRLLKEGICTSDAINMLSSDSEVLFYRLLVVSDDFGNMDGRIAIIKSMCFPLKEKLTTDKITSWMDELVVAKLIQRYKTEEGKEYISILKWNQRQRANAKYPPPTDSNLLTYDSQLSSSGLGLGLGKGLGKGKGNTYAPLERLVSLGIDKQIAKDWIKLRNTQKAPVTDTVINKFKSQAKKANKSLQAVLELCIENSWRGFNADWIEKEQPKSNGHWADSEEATIQEGIRLGRSRLPDEGMKEYRIAIQQIKDARH